MHTEIDRMKKHLLTLIAAAILLTAGAMELPKGMTFAPDGTLQIGDAKLTVSLASTTWNWFDNQKMTNWRSESGGDFQRRTGELLFYGVKGMVTETLRKTGSNRWRFEADVRFETSVFTRTVCAHISLPLPLAGELAVDGRKLLIPGTFGKQVLLENTPVKRVALTLPGGLRAEFSGDVTAYIQDSRRWHETASIRLYFTPGEGNLSEAKIAFDLAVSDAAPRPVALAPAANRSFADPDGSGWIGEGGGNDLGTLIPGRLEVAGFPFEVSPGKGAIVVGRGAPAAVTLPLDGAPAGAVNLLHASSHPPAAGKTLGTIEAVYADGKKETIPVNSGIDCDNWVLNAPRPNAAIAVRLENRSGAVGLYASSFALSGGKPVSLTFRIGDPEAAWMIAGVTLSERRIHFPVKQDQPLTIREGGRWQLFRFERKILPGSPLDFSGFLDAPAGKYGFVRTSSAGHFTFEQAPGKRLRLYGVNLCMSANFPDRETAEELAEYLARMGYNAVRFHHHDNGLVDPKATDSVTLNRENLDRLDYLFAKLKERGIYLTTDLYTSRAFKAGDHLPDCDDYRVGQLMKALLPVNRAAMENWKAFARNWMTHRNPYTGLTWGEDPALVCLNLVNEETLSGYWNRTPETTAIYRAKFEAWKRERNAAESDFPRFLHELQEKVLAEQLAFVKKELKLKTLITSLNYQNRPALTLLRDRFDLVDNHLYFAHPAFPEKAWSLPHRYDQRSAIRRNAIVPRQMMPTRIFGKPFIVTEFNYCNPNIHRAEGGPLMGAYAALQDWDGVWRFAWTHSADTLNKLQIGGCFDAVNDPMQQFGDRIIHALFTRGDLQPAKEKISVGVPADGSGEGTTLEFTDEISTLGLTAQIGSHVEGKALPAGVKPYRPGLAVPADPRLKLDPAAGTFAVATPFSEAVTLPGGTLAAGRLRVREADTFMTVAVLSLDRQPLPQSRSILVIHLTNFTTTGIQFGNGERTRLNSWGTLPLLVERGTARVELAAEAPWRAAALAADGSELGEVQGEFRDGLFRFKADTGGFSGGVAAYHLTR